MLLLSLRALSLVPRAPGSIWKYLEALVRSTGVSGSFACGFQSDLHSPDVTAFLTSGTMRSYGPTYSVSNGSRLRSYGPGFNAD